MKKVLESKKTLDGAVLKISNPPVCNSILVTGLTKKTTKQAIEMYFEDERCGGGRTYRDVIYQKDGGKAVVSFCNPLGKYMHITFFLYMHTHIQVVYIRDKRQHCVEINDMEFTVS